MRHPGALVDWLEQRVERSAADLSLATRLVSPNEASTRARCGKVWLAYIEDQRTDARHDAGVASFGFAIGLADADFLALALSFFQAVFGAQKPECE